MLFVWIKTKDSPTTPQMIWSPVFSRACCWFSHWFIALVTITVIPLVLVYTIAHIFPRLLPCDGHKDEVKHFYNCRLISVLFLALSSEITRSVMEQFTPMLISTFILLFPAMIPKEQGLALNGSNSRVLVIFLAVGSLFVTPIDRSQTFHSPLLSRIFIRSLNGRIELQENWTPTENGNLDKIGRGNQEKQRGCRNL